MKLVIGVFVACACTLVLSAPAEHRPAEINNRIANLLDHPSTPKTEKKNGPPHNQPHSAPPSSSKEPPSIIILIVDEGDSSEDTENSPAQRSPQDTYDNYFNSDNPQNDYYKPIKSPSDYPEPQYPNKYSDFTDLDYPFYPQGNNNDIYQPSSSPSSPPDFMSFDTSPPPRSDFDFTPSNFPPLFFPPPPPLSFTPSPPPSPPSLPFSSPVSFTPPSPPSLSDGLPPNVELPFLILSELAELSDHANNISPGQQSPTII